MAASQTEFRLFISSTFQDLQAERGYLLKHIFPKVRALCRERGIEFTEIDLRWGVTEEEASLGRVIRTCLEEIDNCRPYFLGLLGDRYGWRPELTEVQKDYQLLQKYGWIEDAVIDGASLVEIEFIAGVLNDPSCATGAHFYAREYEDATEEDRTKLDQLKERVSRAGFAVRTFDSLESFGEQVYGSLQSTIERDWPSLDLQSPLESERRVHDVFASTRRKAYIANPRYLKTLQEHAGGVEAPLILHGPSGGGKSALLAYFLGHHRRQHPRAFVIPYFVGASANGTGAETILRHILSEIAERYAISEPVPETKDELVALLPNWLARVQDETLLLVIDAINQLPEPDAQLGWLPEYIPPQVRLILTTTPGSSLEAIRGRAWKEMVLQPLQPSEREALIVRFLGEYHKGLNRSQLERLGRDPKASSPLFLRTLLEELRLSGEFELLDETIDHYLSAKDINELFQFVLERMETDYGHALVASVMSFIAQSRYGLSESELAEITHAERYELSTLLMALDYHLMKPGGKYTFFHDYLRQAVTKRYLANPSIARDRHKVLAKYFNAQDISVRRIEEEPWHWMKAGDKPALKKLLSDLGIFREFVRRDRGYDLLTYWLTLNTDISAAYREAYHHADLGAVPKLDLVRLTNDLAEFLSRAGYYDAAQEFCEQTLTLTEGQEDLLEERLHSLSVLGGVFETTARFDAAEKLAHEALAVAREKWGTDHYSYAEASKNLATYLYQKRDFEKAEEYLQEALRVYAPSFGSTHPEALNCTIDLGAIAFERGDYDRAGSLFRGALSLAERTYGQAHPETAQVLNNLGALLEMQHQSAEAMHYFTRAYEINLAALGPQHTIVATNLCNMGSTAQSLKRYQEAEDYFLRALPIFEAKFGHNSLRAAAVENNIGVLKQLLGQRTEAVAILQHVLEVRRLELGEDHQDTIQSYLNYAKALAHAGQLREALDLYQAYLPKKDAALGTRHPRMQAIYRDYHEILTLAGDIAEASHIEELLLADH